MFFSIYRLLLRLHDDFLLMQQMQLIQSAVPGIPLPMAPRLSIQNQLAKGLILPSPSHLIADLEASATPASDAPIEAPLSQQGSRARQTQ